MNERVAKLEEKVDGLIADMIEVKADVRETRDAVVGAKWAGRLLLGVVGALGVVAGWWIS